MKKRERSNKVLREVVNLAMSIMVAFALGTVFMSIFALTYDSDSLFVITLCSTVFQAAVVLYAVANLWGK